MSMRESLAADAAPRYNKHVLRWIAPVVMMAAICVSIPASAQIPAGSISVTLEEVASGLTAPVMLTHAGDGSNRLFVVDQIGQVRIIQNGVLLPAPFLDVSAKMVSLNASFDERGLLGLAFHPDYETNGRFFIRYSAPRAGDPAEPCNTSSFIVGCHKAILAEYSVSGDPNVADPGSEIILFSVDEPQFNHNSGHIAFGPDGLLYFSLGDGGGANDGLSNSPPSHGPTGNGQNVNTPLGSILRIDVDSGSPYAVPPDNPFASGSGLGEIYAYGFRNPYRFSFDRASSELFVGDVGQGLREEIDVVVKGGNYGWVIREGTICFDPFNATTPLPTCATVGPFGEPLLDPIAEYDHSDGIAIVGGYVYRGGLHANLIGKYIFGDFSRDFGPTGRVFYLDADGDRSQIFEVQLAPPHNPLNLAVLGFGEDEHGELYLLGGEQVGTTGNGGHVFRIVGGGGGPLVPTLSEWGAIVFSLLLLVSVIAYVRRRNLAAAI